MSSQDNKYAFHLKQKEKLSELISRQETALTKLEMSTWLQNIKQLKERVSSESFKVLVIGQFKTGKSTFINALLRQEILPSYAVPTTAIINEIKWGDDKHAILHYRLDPDTGLIKAPEKIAVEDIEKYVVINDVDNHQQEVRENKYEKVELFYPLELLRDNNVEIIDSPGLNENKVREQVTLNYLASVDAIVFMFTALAFGPSIYENNALIDFRASGHQDIFFVLNRFDGLRDKDKELVQNRALSKLSHLTDLGKEGIFFVSALQALNGFTDQDEALVQQSNILELEKTLEKFLVNQRGRVKLIRTARELSISVNEGLKSIPARIEMLNTEIGTLEQRIEDTRAPLRKLRKDKEDILRKIEAFKDDVSKVVGQKALIFFSELANQISGWIEEYEIQEPINALEVPTIKQAIERVSNELLVLYETKTDQEFKKWQQIELWDNYLKGRFSFLESDLSENASRFLEKVEKIKAELVGSEKATDINREGIGPEVTPLERILAAAGGLLIGGIGAAGIGAVFGYQEMLKTLFPQIAAGVVAGILFGFTPQVLIPTLIVAGGFHYVKKMMDMNNLVKEKMTSEFRKSLIDRRPDLVNKLTATVKGKIEDFEKKIEDGLSNEIQTIEEQINTTMREKKQGQEAVNARIKELDATAEELKSISNELIDLIIELNESKRSK